MVSVWSIAGVDQEFSQLGSDVLAVYTAVYLVWAFLGKRLLLWVCGCRHSIYNYVVMTTRKLVHDEVKIFWCYGVSCPVVHAPFTAKGAWMTGHETTCCMNYHVHSTWVCYQASNLIMHAWVVWFPSTNLAALYSNWAFILKHFLPAKQLNKGHMFLKVSSCEFTWF